jgi:glycosyltransferase involved in cell wall biosynthesis
MPRVSVLLPVYNNEAYLRPAVESILSQSFQDFELLVLDDGSSDRSLEILQSYLPRLKITSRENRGFRTTLNELISMASGEYLARMDADDISEPDRLKKQVKFLDENPDHVIVGGGLLRINCNGLPIGYMSFPISHEEIDAANLIGHTSISHPAAMIRRSTMVSIGGYRDFPYAEDLDLWLRLAEVGKLANLPLPVLNYRIHAGSASVKNQQVQVDAMEAACREAWTRRGISLTFEGKHWRPTEDTQSMHKFAVEYAWVAWAHGHAETFRAYAWEAFLLRPFAAETWRLIVFGFFRKPANGAHLPL